MKVFFVGYHNPHFLTITEYEEMAIRSLGHKILSFDNRRFLIPGRVREKIPLLHDIEIRRINHQLIRRALDCNPELCFLSGGYRIMPETIRRLKCENIITVLRTIDIPHDFQTILEVAPLADFVYYGGTEAKKLLEQRTIKQLHWLPFACDTNYHKPVILSEAERKYYRNDVVFVGSFYENRLKMLEHLAGFDLGIWGPGWEKVPADSPIKKAVRKAKHIKPEEWTKIFAAAKIVVAVHFESGTIPCYQVSPKVYESLACRCFLMVDNQRDLAALFKDREHLVAFNDADDLKEKIKYYLLHAEERSHIAAEGYRETVNNHTYVHRFQKVFQDLKEAKSEPERNF